MKINFKKFFSIFLLLVLLSGCVTHRKSGKDVEGYLESYNELLENADFHSELYLFPNENQLEENKILKYSYAQRDDLFTGSYVLYLKLEFSSTKDLQKEIERLGSITCKFMNGLTKNIIRYDENTFLSIYDGGRYEYAIVHSEDNYISYISNQLFEFAETNIDLKDRKQTFNLTDSQDDDLKPNTYNMYYHFTYDEDLKTTIGYYIDEEFD